MAATIKDIAKTLNISVSTVSYALNGGPRSVPEEVKKEVFRVAKELQYRPNRLARSLITGKTSTIGVVPSTTHLDLVLSPYLQAALNGIINEAELHHNDVLIFTRCDQTDSIEVANALLDGRVDGLVFIAPPKDSPLLHQVRDANIPHVTVAASGLNGGLEFMCDNGQGVRLAMDHLTELGHRKIGHISGQGRLIESRLREDEFFAYVKKHAIENKPEWNGVGNFMMEQGQAAAREILSRQDRPTALFCANDEIAIGAIRAATKLGIRVPEDLSIIGFDDVPMGSVVVPNLTTIRQPTQELGLHATRTLMKILAGAEEGQSLTLPNQLVIRNSTCRAN